MRQEVDKWRALPNPADWRVTPETARLLQHWRHHEFSGARPFFCQIEAVETAIWLTEVAPQFAHHNKTCRTFLDHLKHANQEANPGLARLALKLATGAGKTTVMAMLIAWQTINAVRHPTSQRFTRGFLVVTPGLTIKDRLAAMNQAACRSFATGTTTVRRWADRAPCSSTANSSNPAKRWMTTSVALPPLRSSVFAARSSSARETPRPARRSPIRNCCAK